MIVEQNVRRLQIEMQNTFGVSECDRFGQSFRQEERIVPRGCTLIDSVLKRPARIEGHDEIGISGRRYAGLIDRHDVGNRGQFGHDRTFSLESSAHCFVASTAEHLHCNELPCGALEGPIDVRVPTGSNQFEALETVELHSTPPNTEPGR